MSISINKLRHDLELASRTLEQLKENSEKLNKRKGESEVSREIHKLIEQKNVEEIKNMLLSKYHKIVLRILFDYFDLQESKIEFLYNQFDSTFHFSPDLVPQNEKIFNKFLFKLKKQTKHKPMHHEPMSEWYEKRKSIKEQGESNW